MSDLKGNSIHVNESIEVRRSIGSDNPSTAKKYSILMLPAAECPGMLIQFHFSMNWSEFIVLKPVSELLNLIHSIIVIKAWIAVVKTAIHLIFLAFLLDMS